MMTYVWYRNALAGELGTVQMVVDTVRHCRWSKDIKDIPVDEAQAEGSASGNVSARGLQKWQRLKEINEHVGQRGLR